MFRSLRDNLLKDLLYLNPLFKSQFDDVDSLQSIDKLSNDDIIKLSEKGLFAKLACNLDLMLQ